MKKPINMVSIITPAYNVEHFISATIQSVINQTFTNWEMIIIDDGSSDNTLTIIQEFIAIDNRIKLLKHNQNFGSGFARNTGIKKAIGNYIAFLDADDLWVTHKLETQLTFMKVHKITISFSSYELIDEQGNALNKMILALPRVTYNKQLKCNYIGNLTGIYNAAILGKLYMPEIKKRQDWVMWLNAIKKGGEARGIKESLAKYRIRKDAVSSNKVGLLKHNYNVYRKELGFSMIKATAYLLLFLIEYFFIKSKQIKSI
jgi:glycosyltransferase involved in cell wall biosynthesis